MKNKFTLHIPSPCAADWNQMQEADQGRFCLSCQKTVVDFSEMDEAAIKTYFRNSPGKVCGRFQPNQLKEYSWPVRRKPVLTFLSVLGLTALMAPTTGFSQPPPTQTQTPANPVLPIAQLPPPAPESRIYTVKGKISENGTQEPLPGVSILMAGTQLGTISGADGSFQFSVSTSYLEKATLVFSFIGYTPVEKEVSFKNSAAVEIKEINLTLDAQVLGEVVYLGTVSTTRYQPRNVWGRVKQLFGG